MKTYTLLAAVFALGLTLVSADADAARRFGGGKSVGMQRQATPAPQKSTNTTQKADNAQQPGGSAAAPAAQPRRSWMGPIAGLAAGLGLAALASHLGLGEEFANFLLIALLVMGALMALSWFMRRRNAAHPARASGMQYAGAGAPHQPRHNVHDLAMPGGSAAPTATAAPAATGNIPADFDVAGFIRNAKVGFIRLQAANDVGDLDDIRTFTSPEVFAEIKMSLGERGSEPQETDVVDLDAELLEVVEEDGRYIASVQFTGHIREGKDAAPEAFAEIWHVARPVSGKSGWLVQGIQQIQ